MTVRETEVRDAEGRVDSLRVRPYKDQEYRIDGAVVALFEVDTATADRHQLADSLGLVEALIEIVEQPLVVLDEQHRVHRVNRTFRERFGVRPDEIAGKPLTIETDSPGAGIPTW